MATIRSGQSIFTRPKPIDLSQAGIRGRGRLDIDLSDDEDDQYGRPRGLYGQNSSVVFDVGQEQAGGGAAPAVTGDNDWDDPGWGRTP